MTRLLVLLATIACVSPAAASDQSRVRLASLTCPTEAASCMTAAPRRDAGRGQIMLAQRRFDCFDRCFADFKSCLGEPTRTDPPVIIREPPIGSSRSVPTPPPFEFCIRVKQECEATCVGIDPPARK
jgi:hypothetical protein